MTSSAVAPGDEADREGGVLRPHAAETVPGGEAAAIAAITEVSLDLLDPWGRSVRRGQHGKSHGLVRAEFTVKADLPAELRHGIFAEPRTEPYPALVRFSNGAHDDDRQKGVHGMAIKLLEVPGAKLLPRERDEKTHDFILMDAPTFFIRDAAEYASFSRLTRAVFRGARWVPARFRPGFQKKVVLPLNLLAWRPRVAFRISGVRQRPPGSPLAVTYHSCTPYALGPKHAIRFRAVPAGQNGSAPRPAGKRSENFLREAMAAHLKDGRARFCFQVQTNPDRQLVEDPTVAWSEKEFPFQTVATLEIPAQEFDTAKVRDLDESLSFTPWHAIEAHRPLGGINRARRATYEALSARRHALNAVPMVEPTGDVIDAAWNKG